LKVLSKPKQESQLCRRIYGQFDSDGIAILESEEFKITFSFEEIDQVSSGMKNGRKTLKL
jgi:hypothetical protein